MSDEVQNKGAGDKPTGGQPMTEVEFLKASGMYKPGYCETIEQANKRFSGLLDENQRLGSEVGQYRTRKVVETPPADDADDQPVSQPAHDENLWKATINNSFKLFRLQFTDFVNYENEITAQLVQEPNKSAAKYDMVGTIENIYLTLRGRQAIANEEKQRKDAELKDRRDSTSRIPAGQGSDHAVSTPLYEIDQKIDAAFKYHAAHGESGFVEKHKKGLAPYISELNEEKVALAAKDSQGG